jgi:lambda family phage tail tape measure protein
MVALQREAQAAGLSLTEMVQVPGIQDKAREIAALRAAFLGITDGSAGGGRGFVNPVLARPKLAVPGAPDKKGSDPFAAIAKSLQEQIALQEAQLSSATKLTEAQKLQAKLYADIDSGVVQLTLDQKLLVDGWLQQLLALDQLAVAQGRVLAAGAQRQKDMEAELEAGDRVSQNLREEEADLNRHLKVYGLSAQALDALAAAEDRQTAALLREKAAAIELSGAFEDRVAQLRAQADALDRLAAKREALNRLDQRERNDPLRGAQRAVTGYLDEVAAAGIATERLVGDAMRGLEDGMVQLFTRGRWDAKSFVDQLIAEFFRLRVIKPLLAEIFGGGSSGGAGGLVGGFLKLVLGGGGGVQPYNGGFDANGIFDGRAAGGPVEAGRPYIVGEKRPELFVPRTAGTIVPSVGGVNVTYAPQISIDSRSDRAQVAVAVGQAVAEGNRQFFELLRARGVVQ